MSHFLGWCVQLYILHSFADIRADIRTTVGLPEWFGRFGRFEEAVRQFAANMNTTFDPVPNMTPQAAALLSRTDHFKKTASKTRLPGTSRNTQNASGVFANNKAAEVRKDRADKAAVNQGRKLYVATTLWVLRAKKRGSVAGEFIRVRVFLLCSSRTVRVVPRCCMCCATMLPMLRHQARDRARYPQLAYPTHY